MLSLVPVLNWPASLFSQPHLMIANELTSNSTASLLGRRKLIDDHLCACGCRQPHNNAVSRVIENDGPFGYNRSIAWYRSLEHRNKHAGLIP